MEFDKGNPCEISELVSTKALALAEYLNSDHNSFANLTECRLSESKDIICFTVQPELSQLKSVDIRNIEPIAVHFDRQDKIPPTVYAMRKDFPRQIPHLNLDKNGWPANLCLYSEAYRDLKPYWTSARFVERIRNWLKETSTGTLHEQDQPLEPLFFGSGWRIILPHGLYDTVDEGVLIKRLILVESGEALHAMEVDKLPKDYRPKNGKYPPTAFCIKSLPQEHGIISHTPLCLHDVSQLMAKTNYNLYDEFYSSIKSGSLKIDDSVLNSQFCLISWFPKKRNSDTEPETTDVWVFFSTKTVAEMLVDIGVYDCIDKIHSLRIMGRDEVRDGKNIDIIPLNPSFTLSPGLAAVFNGYEEESLQKVLSIGAGAIGSNIILNSVKAGFGKWILVDDDIILPHNLARYALDGTYLGWSKVEALKTAANMSVSGKPVLDAFKADFMQPPEDSFDKIAEHLKDSDVILDMSASVSVARHITHETTSPARRVSMFLSPSGKDLVILAEDNIRKTRLDLLEMLYYREIIQNEDLKDHLATTAKTRYANSCRDLSSRISQDHIALYSAIGSRNLRQIASNNAACVKIYRADSDLQTSLTSVSVEEFSSIKLAYWEVFICRSVIQSLFANRQNKLPNETGGVLVGAFNVQHRAIYIVDIVGNITDSIEYPDAFIRGYKGLSDQIKFVQDETAGNLSYAGEWHSHPDHAKCLPSNDDQQVMQWITDHMSVEGLPSIMLIAGDKGQLCVCIEKETKILECNNVR